MNLLGRQVEWLGLQAYYVEHLHMKGLVEPLSWDELKEIDSRGHFIESHGAGHLNYDFIGDDEARTDLHRSRDRIAEYISRAPRVLQYLMAESNVLKSGI